jgi:UDP-N-acetylglucosamine--N-acetylmuramyl-(pentapeptide) pyrophosphoryl-undecaprenol N-acetylglucosamine transferase
VKVIISGGGTGGHIYPGIAIAKAFMESYPTAKILFVGTPSGLEAEIIPKSGFNFKPIELQGFNRKRPLVNLVTVFKAIKACATSFGFIRHEKPDIVIGTGGYVCGPVLLCAALQGVPTLIQEQNAFPGITNRILSRFVRKIAVGYEESVAYFKFPERIVVTGNPIRTEILGRTRKDGIRAFGLDPVKTTLLVFGNFKSFNTDKHITLIYLPRIVLNSRDRNILIPGNLQDIYIF